MKSKFLRILALILVMTSLLSMFVIFASAAEPTGTTGGNKEEEVDTFKLIYNRSFDEGWDMLNGTDKSSGDLDKTRFDIDSEVTLMGKYNYFCRLTLGTTENRFVQINGDSKNVVGSVIEFDFMTDDLTSLSNPVIVHTKGASASDVTPINLLKIVDNEVSIMGTPAFTMVNETWYRMQLIFDYTEATSVEEDNPSETFKLTVKYGPADGSSPMKVLGGEPMEMVAKSGNGIRLIRFQSTGSDADNLGNSLCLDNIKYYEGVNQLVPITREMGYGTAVNATYAVTEEIKGDAGLSGGATDLYSTLSMKVGVNYCFANKTKAPIFTADDGTVYGAPVKQNGKVMVPLLTVLKYMGYEASVHPDGIYIDVPTGTTPALHLIVGKSTANMGDRNIELTAAPAYATDKNGNSVKTNTVTL